MPVAIFILLVMAGFAAALNRMSAQTAVMVPQEMLSTAAFYAAEAGAQVALNQIFYTATGVVTRTNTDSGCTAASTPPASPLSFTAPGLSSCTTTIHCAINIDAGNTTSFYNITSEASCGSGDVTAQRTIAVSSFMQ